MHHSTYTFTLTHLLTHSTLFANKTETADTTTTTTTTIMVIPLINAQIAFQTIGITNLSHEDLVLQCQTRPQREHDDENDDDDFDYDDDDANYYYLHEEQFHSIAYKSLKQIQQAKQVFRLIDATNKGFITIEDLLSIVRELQDDNDDNDNHNDNDGSEEEEDSTTSSSRKGRKAAAAATIRNTNRNRNSNNEFNTWTREDLIEMIQEIRNNEDTSRSGSSNNDDNNDILDVDDFIMIATKINL